MALETVRFSLLDTETPAAAIEGATVRVFTSTGVFTTSGVTDSNGIVDISLNGSTPGTTYIIRLYKFGVSFTTPQSISVISPPPSEGNNFRGYGDINAASSPADARLCRCSGYLRYPNGDPYLGRVRFAAKHPTIVDNTGILGPGITVQADQQGYLSVDLFRTGTYIATIESFSDDERTIYIPDRGTTNLPSLLYPSILLIEYSPVAPFNIAVGGSLTVTPTVTASDYRVLTGVADSDIQWSVDDVTVASLQIDTSGGTFTLTGIGNGTTALRAIRRDTTISRIPASFTGETATIVVT